MAVAINAPRQKEAPGGCAVSMFRQAALAGLATVSMAIALAMSSELPASPPSAGGLHSTACSIALSGAFLAGTAGVLAAVWVSGNPPARRRAAGRKLAYASVVPLAVVAGLLLASLLW
ncbi:hypothetical protein PAHAL_5G471800 [Panicum hallii]|jgi:hypothetical protein|uniref:Uncharacterized protein n=1 Tax=Panicum hallii TaxID=206008 RepID=A0A2T8INP1_9POAL|nr:hypothetical protein PAHAL_5G471800 [Panicum hallii]